MTTIYSGSNGIIIADDSALTSILSTNLPTTSGQRVILFHAARNRYVYYDPAATSGDFTPSDSPTTGRWKYLANGTVNSPLTVIQNNSAQSFEMKSRVTTSLTTIPVPILRPTTSTSVIAFDIMPNGAPSDFGSNGVAWFDVCNVDVHTNENPVCCNRIGIGNSRATSGITVFNGGTTIPLDFVMGTYVPFTIQTTGYTNFGRNLYPSTPAQAQQSDIAITGGIGIPSNSNGSNGDIYFRADGTGNSCIYQKRSGQWVLYSDPLVSWFNTQNASLADGYIVNNGSIPSGASSNVTIDATKAFSYIISLESSSLQEGITIYLENTNINNFNWTSGNSLISYVYMYLSDLQVGVTAGTVGTNIYTVSSFPTYLKVEKSGNDLVYSTSTDGITYTPRYTHTGVLTSLTTIYLKTLFAIAGSTKKIKISQYQ